MSAAKEVGTKKTAAKEKASKTSKKETKTSTTAVKKISKKDETKILENTKEPCLGDILNAKFDDLQNEFEKIKAELSIIKQFKNSSDKSPNDKVFAEIEKLKEIIFGLEDRIEELEYQVSEKDDY